MRPAPGLRERSQGNEQALSEALADSPQRVFETWILSADVSLAAPFVHARRGRLWPGIGPFPRARGKAALSEYVVMIMPEWYDD